MDNTGSQGEQTAAFLSWAGLVLGPVLAILILWLVPAAAAPDAGSPPPGTLTTDGRAVLAVAALMAVWWLSEAVPLAVTALVPLVLLPLLRILPIKQAAAPYADDTIFLFLGGFLLGRALEATGLHRRIALITLLGAGTNPRYMVLGVMLATALLSMWVSNTATAVMMTPIALSMVALVEARQLAGADRSRQSRNFAVAMLLGVAYAASVGGIGTKIGTPPNLYMLRQAERVLGSEISFGQWLRVALPVVVVLLPALWGLLIFVLHPVRAEAIPGGRRFIREQIVGLGPMKPSEWVTMGVFGAAAFCWIFRNAVAAALGLSEDGTAWLTDAGIAITAAVALFIIPTRLRPREHALTWAQAERLPWGVLLLFGGGLSIAAAMGKTGLDAFLGAQFGALADLPFWLVLLAICAGLVFFGELASNTAVAATFMPVLAAAAVESGWDPMVILFAATFAASCGFMLPVATPPNAIAFATGRIGLRQMIRAGFIADVVSITVIVAVMHLLGPALVRWADLDRRAAAPAASDKAERLLP